MIKKHFYEAPETELLVVRFEGNFCATGDNPNGTEGSTVTSPFDDWDD